MSPLLRGSEKIFIFLKNYRQHFGVRNLCTILKRGFRCKKTAFVEIIERRLEMKTTKLLGFVITAMLILGLFGRAKDKRIESLSEPPESATTADTRSFSNHYRPFSILP
jgi:hypothetical protein